MKITINKARNTVCALALTAACVTLVLTGHPGFATAFFIALIAVLDG